jgi:hypothetical protein
VASEGNDAFIVGVAAGGISELVAADLLNFVASFIFSGDGKG